LVTGLIAALTAFSVSLAQVSSESTDFSSTSILSFPAFVFFTLIGTVGSLILGHLVVAFTPFYPAKRPEIGAQIGGIGGFAFYFFLGFFDFFGEWGALSTIAGAALAALTGALTSSTFFCLRRWIVPLDIDQTRSSSGRAAG
jgi:hypothetical protein